MIWDRDYMKERPQSEEDEQAESQSIPFNLFAGLKAEPLAPPDRPPNRTAVPAESESGKTVANEAIEKPNHFAILIAVAMLILIISILAMNL
jgi:hypothetical protein